jgi:hypothetical protein
MSTSTYRWVIVGAGGLRRLRGHRAYVLAPRVSACPHFTGVTGWGRLTSVSSAMDHRASSPMALASMEPGGPVCRPYRALRPVRVCVLC